MTAKSIPKSILKIGIKLPQFELSKANNNVSLSTSTPDLPSITGALDAQEEKKSELSGLERVFLENPFIQHDQKLLGKSLFRPSFSRFGGKSREQWKGQQPQDEGHMQQPRPDDECLSQRERVRRELAQVLLRKAHPDSYQNHTEEKEEQDVDSDLLSPRDILRQQQNKQFPVTGDKGNTGLRAWPSSPAICLAKEDLDNEQQTQINNHRNKKKTKKAKEESSRKVSSSSEFGTMKRSHAPLSQCFRCKQPVYPLEKVEPVAGQKYHPQCFRCSQCQTKLSLATFFCSLESARDRAVYCRQHQPKGDKVFLCRFSTRKSQFPAFKLSWQQTNSKDEDKSKHQQPG